MGFVNHPSDPGGTTKFGIAQKYNKGIRVEDVTYSQARDAGYNNFWAGKLPGKTAAAGKKKSSIAMFNIGFLCGNGGLNSIVRAANIDSLSDEAAVDAICNSMKKYLLDKIAESPKKANFKNGWMARVETVRNYAKAANVA